MQNGFVESFNAWLRNEWLNVRLFAVLRYCHWRPRTQCPFAAIALAHRQPFLPVDRMSQ
jgi:hypothetical protein